MSEIDTLQTARIFVDELGDEAEAEVNRLAEKALADGDMDAFAVWRSVIISVSDIQSRK
jgi:hypothetical protein